MQKVFLKSMVLWIITIATLINLGASWGQTSSWVLSVSLMGAGPLLEVCLVVDEVATVFWLTVATISASVFLFSSSYMASEIFLQRFNWLVMTFVSSMFMFIASGNLLTALVGWDGLGVTSFLLVIFFSSKKAINSGLLTFFINRAGDALIILSLGVLYMSVSEGGQSFVFFWGANTTSFYMVVIIFVTSMTKSAQIPFSAWLPAAMAAPTPVSALVHSSTLVTAGIFVLMRLFHLYEPSTMIYLTTVVGGGTSILAGVSAMMENDLKKIIALSTLSQLGIMFLGMSSLSYEVGYFHLLSHAFFKAMLFILVGHLIHLSQSLQDMRTMKHKMWQFPLTLSLFVAGNFSLMGLPFMSGFISKDSVIEASWAESWGGPLSSILLYISCALTVSYTLRLLSSLSKGASQSLPWGSGEEADKKVFLSTLVLFLFSVAGASVISKVCLPSKLFDSSAEVKLTILSILSSGLIIWAGASKLGTSFVSSAGLNFMLGLSWFSYASVGKTGLKLGFKYLNFTEHFMMDSVSGSSREMKSMNKWQLLSSVEFLIAMSIAMMVMMI